MGCFLKMGYLIHYQTIVNIWESWLTKIDFGQPNAKIGRKMANGRLISRTAASILSLPHNLSLERHLVLVCLLSIFKTT